jgi:hypothetical protein
MGGRCPSTNELTLSRPKGGHHNTNMEEECRDGRTGVVWRRRSSGSAAAGKPCTEGYRQSVRTPRPAESSIGDLARPRRCPLSTCTPNIREGEHGRSRRYAIETRVLDGRANDGRMVRSLVGCPIGLRVPIMGTTHRRGGRRDSIFSFMFVSLPPFNRPRDDGDLDEEARRAWRSNNDLGMGLRDATGGSTRDHARKGISPPFPLLSLASLKPCGS